MQVKIIKTAAFKKELRQIDTEEAQLNIKHVLKTLPMQEFCRSSFDNEETVVLAGQVVADLISNFPVLDYAEVPLGIITKGQIVVFENGRAVRHLCAGDFIGLFEVAHYLRFGSKKKIGNWTLLAEGKTDIVFFGRTAFDHSKIAVKKNLEYYLIQLAKKDRTPKPLTDLPLLDQFADTANLTLQDDVIVIAHTHILESSYAFFRHLAAVVGYQNIFIMEKPYSTVPSVADKVVEMGCDLIRVPMRKGVAYEFAVQDSIRVLWRKVLEQKKRIPITKIIVVDDGADVLTNIPWADLKGITVVGIDQTTRGIIRLNESCGKFPPVISVAGSALKKEIESGFIAKAIVQETKRVLKGALKKKIGVVGAGNIGMCIIEQFKKNDLQLSYYDILKINSLAGGITSISEVIEKNDVIIGATGKDFLRGVVLDKAKGDKHLISASSADVEYYSILNRAGFLADSFETIDFSPVPGLHLKILNGGYPINFNRRQEIEHSEDIQLTRALLFAGFVDALNETFKNKPMLYKLSTKWQREILNIWMAVKKDNDSNKVLTTKQIEKLSEGESFEK